MHLNYLPILRIKKLNKCWHEDESFVWLCLEFICNESWILSTISPNSKPNSVAITELQILSVLRTLQKWILLATVVLRIHRCTSALHWSTNDVVNMPAVYLFLWYIFILLKTIKNLRSTEVYTPTSFEAWGGPRPLWCSADDVSSGNTLASSQHRPGWMYVLFVVQPTDYRKSIIEDF